MTWLNWYFFMLLMATVTTDENTSTATDSYKPTASQSTALNTISTMLLSTEQSTATSANMITAQITESSTTTSDASATKKTKNAQKHIPLKFLVRNQQHNQEYDTYVGAKITINCSVSGYPIPKMTWAKDDEPIHKRSYRMFNYDMSDVFVITLKGLLTADSGKYKCTADNGYSKAITTTITLVVSENSLKKKPQIEYFAPRRASIYVGESLTFNCNAKHIKDLKSPFIKWSRYSFYNQTTVVMATPNTNMTTIHPKTTTTETSTEDTTVSVIERLGNIMHTEDGIVHQHVDLQLNQCEQSYYIIKSATLEDTGEYTCRVFNENGFSEEIAYLLVKPIPPPTREELEKRYMENYGKNINLPYPLAVLVCLPTFLLVLLIVGCVYVRSREEVAAEKIEEAKRKAAENVVIEAKSQKAVKPAPFIFIPDITVHFEDNLSKYSNHNGESTSTKVLMMGEESSNASLAGSYKLSDKDGSNGDKAPLLVDSKEIRPDTTIDA